ncbi:MAG: AraC family transcriptional regulator [Bacteroidaceae bacterium]|nr:AraC family transcriptional regulator [Bacteroidaceae bacterium]
MVKNRVAVLPLFDFIIRLFLCIFALLCVRIVSYITNLAVICVASLAARLKYELSYTTKNIQELSDDFNFPSQSYFTRYYKRMTGLTPSEFRKERAIK